MGARFTGLEKEVFEHLYLFHSTAENSEDEEDEEDEEKLGYWETFAFKLEHLFGDTRDHSKGNILNRVRRLASPLPTTEERMPDQYDKDVIGFIAKEIDFKDSRRGRSDEEVFNETARLYGHVRAPPNLASFMRLKDWIMFTPVSWSSMTKYHCHLLYSEIQPSPLTGPRRMPDEKIANLLKERGALEPEEGGMKQEEYFSINPRSVRHCVLDLITRLPFFEENGPKSLKWFASEEGGQQPDVQRIKAAYGTDYDLTVQGKNRIELIKTNQLAQH